MMKTNEPFSPIPPAFMLWQLQPNDFSEQVELWLLWARWTFKLLLLSTTWGPGVGRQVEKAAEHNSWPKQESGPGPRQFQLAHAIYTYDNTKGRVESSMSDSQSKCVLSIIGTNEDDAQLSSSNGFISINCEWIMDTGPLMHKTGCSSLLEKSKLIGATSPVYIPNGKSLQAKWIKEVNLGGQILLTGVLSIPNFNFNLIFMGRLINQLNCRVIFF